MNDEQEKHQRSRLQHEAEHAKAHKKVSVIGYLAILFAAAFLLLLLTYFMQQRSAEQTISGLTNSVTSMQTVGNLLETNKALQEQADTLQEQMNALEQQAAALETQNSALQAAADLHSRQLQGMDWLWRIQRAFSRGAKSEARALIEQFEATGLAADLPQTSPSHLEGTSPADQYDALLQALNAKKAEP